MARLDKYWRINHMQPIVYPASWAGIIYTSQESAEAMSRTLNARPGFPKTMAILTTLGWTLTLKAVPSHA